MRKSHFNDEFLVLLGPIISRLFTCSNEEKKGACSSPPISMSQACRTTERLAAKVRTRVKLRGIQLSKQVKLEG